MHPVVDLISAERRLWARRHRGDARGRLAIGALDRPWLTVGQIRSERRFWYRLQAR